MSLLNFVSFSAARSRSKVTESVKVTHGTVRDFHGLDYGEQALKLSKQPKSSWCGVFFPAILAALSQNTGTTTTTMSRSPTKR